MARTVDVVVSLRPSSRAKERPDVELEGLGEGAMAWLGERVEVRARGARRVERAERPRPLDRGTRWRRSEAVTHRCITSAAERALRRPVAHRGPDARNSLLARPVENSQNV